MPKKGGKGREHVTVRGLVRAEFSVRIPSEYAQDPAVWGDIRDPAFAAVLRAMQRGFLHYAWGTKRAPARVQFAIDPDDIEVATDERDEHAVLGTPSPTDDTGLHRAVRERCRR